MKLTERHIQLLIALKEHRDSIWNIENCPMSTRLLAEVTDTHSDRVCESCGDLVADGLIIIIKTDLLPMYIIKTKGIKCVDEIVQNS